MKNLAFIVLVVFCSVGTAQWLQSSLQVDVGVTSPAQTFCSFLAAEKAWGLRSSYRVDHFENVLSKLNATLDTHNKYLKIESYWNGLNRKDSKRDENLEKFHQLMIELFKDSGYDLNSDIQIEKGHTSIQSLFIKSGDVLARPVFNTKSNQLDLQLIRRFTDLQNQMSKAAESGKPMGELTEDQNLRLAMIDRFILLKSNSRAFITFFPDTREIPIETIERTSSTPREECR